MKPVLLATRGSALALAQAEQTAHEFSRRLGRPVELIRVATQGDQSSAPLHEIGGTGVFVAAVRQAVLDGRADLCIHSLKDLPTAPADGLDLVAIPERGPVGDVLVSRDNRRLADLAEGAVVGTGSPRRAAQLRQVRPDLEVRGLRGNIDSRIGAVDRGDLDAVVLAEAGLWRLGLVSRISEVLSVESMLPAPGQGALGVEIASDRSGHDLVSTALAVDHGETRAAVTAERAALAGLEAGCTAPVGALARVSPDGTELGLVAAVFGAQHGQMVRESSTGSVGEAQALGQHVAAQLLSAGAGRYMGERVQ
jgi:hydroxymethylbilane synthase